MSTKIGTKSQQTKKELMKKTKDVVKDSTKDTRDAKETKDTADVKLAPKAQNIELDGEAESKNMIDPDELEEQEENADAESSRSSGNAAALAAAASGSTEMSASFKNFRHHPDMENFYRFIYENDLRHEALAIIEQIMVEKQQRKLIKGAKTQAH